jgi:hypothetical protein
MTLDVATLISELGFPIALVVYLLYDHRQIRQQRREERQSWRGALVENTAAIRSLREELARLREHADVERVTDGGEPDE